MVTTLFSEAVARDSSYCFIEYLRRRVTFTQVGKVVTVGVLPPNAIVIGGGIFKKTVFNGTTNTANVGHADNPPVPNAFASGLALYTKGFMPFDEVEADLNTQSSVERTVTVTITAAGATTGDCVVIVLFVSDHG